MDSPLVYILVAIILILVVALGTVSWYTIKLLFHKQQKCVDNWHEAVEKCRESHLHVNEFNTFKEGYEKIIDKIDKTLESVHTRLNDMPGTIRALFDSEIKYKNALGEHHVKKS
jgi:soluble cytochrome b562